MKTFIIAAFVAVVLAQDKMHEGHGHADCKNAACKKCEENEEAGEKKCTDTMAAEQKKCTGSKSVKAKCMEKQSNINKECLENVEKDEGKCMKLAGANYLIAGATIIAAAALF